MRPLYVVLLPVLLALVIAAHVRGATGGPCDPRTAAVDSDEAQFLQLINGYRAQSGLGPLVVSQRLTAAAAWMAEDLAAKGYFSHTDSLGRLPWDRTSDCGYPQAGVGENIAGGTDTAQRALAAWQGSPGHNANMLGAQWEAIGIARVKGGVYGWTWVTDFGSVVDSPAPTSTPTPAPAGCQYPRGWTLTSLVQVEPCVRSIYLWDGNAWHRWFRDAPAWASDLQWVPSGQAVWVYAAP